MKEYSSLGIENFICNTALPHKQSIFTFVCWVFENKKDPYESESILIIMRT